MNDFVDYEPDVRSAGPTASVAIRSAVPTDVDALAAVMSVRGGAVQEYAERASRLIELLDVLLIADEAGTAVGWCGVQKFSIQPEGEPEWLVAGLTVVPELRRQGIAARLLRGVLGAIAESAPDEPVISVVNARNRASIDLHEQLGFAEIGRVATFAGIDFIGGEGVLLRYS